LRVELADGRLRDLGCLEVDRVQVLVGDLAAGELELAPLLAVRLVGDGRTEHAEADLLAVDLHLERGLELAGALLLLGGPLAHEAVARESPQLAQAAVAVDCRADRLRRVEGGELGMALVDRLDLERLLAACEMD